MLTLVIATGYALSLALFDGDRLLRADDRDGGMGQADALVPAIAAMMAARQAGRVVVEVGPGSFTGLRIALAAASALALAWESELVGVSSSALVAAPLFERHDEPAIWVALAAPRGQLWLEGVSAGDCASLGAPVSLRDPAEAVFPAGVAAAGSAAGWLVGARVLDARPPRASGWRSGVARLPAAPRYVRPADHRGA